MCLDARKVFALHGGSLQVSPSYEYARVLCCFRLGGVAFLMSNRHADRNSYKYMLRRIVRTHRTPVMTPTGMWHHDTDLADGHALAPAAHLNLQSDPCLSWQCAKVGDLKHKGTN